MDLALYSALGSVAAVTMGVQTAVTLTAVPGTWAMGTEVERVRGDTGKRDRIGARLTTTVVAMGLASVATFAVTAATLAAWGSSLTLDAPTPLVTAFVAVVLVSASTFLTGMFVAARLWMKGRS